MRKFTSILLFTAAFLLFLVVAFLDSAFGQSITPTPSAIFQPDADNSTVTPEVLAIITAILGVAMPFIVQGIKKVSGTNGKLANALSLAVSFAIAGLVLALFGKFSLSNIAASVGLVYTVGNLIFTQFFKEQKWTPDESETGLDRNDEDIIV